MRIPELMSSISNLPSHEVQRTQQTPLSRSVSRETNHSFSSSTKRAPIRAVFQDLHTAHLCITSGLAKSRSQNISSSLLQACSEEDTVSLASSHPPKDVSGAHQHNQDFHATSKPHSLSQFYDAISDSPPNGSRALSDNNNPQQLSINSEISDQKADLFSGFDNSLVAEDKINSSAINFETCDLALPPQQMSNPDAFNPTLPDYNLLNPAVKKDGLSSVHKATTLQRKSVNVPLATEESTVDNIYRHYADSSICDGESERSTSVQGIITKNEGQTSTKNIISFISQSEDDAKPSALNIRRQRRLDRLMSGPQSQPPTCALPALPPSVLLRFPSITPHGFSEISSHGETKSSLQVAQKNLTAPKSTLSRSEGRTDLCLQTARAGLKPTTESVVLHSCSNNPFWRSKCSRSVENQDSSTNYLLDDGQNSQQISSGREPLEREVSNALRRASGFSVFSCDSDSTSFPQDLKLQESMSGIMRNSLVSPAMIKDASPPGSRNSDTNAQNVTAPAQGFYDERAISLSWITSNQKNAVRVPISQKERQTSFTPAPHYLDDAHLELQDNVPIDDPEGDPNDWETVGESRFGAEFKGNRGESGILEASTIRRTGSSLANTSNDGTNSLYEAESDAYGSTERIAQHPGPIRYSSDYRLHDLNNTPTPVFPAVYREHKVNGYLADIACHPPPSSPFNHAPKPLGNAHAHPFRSPPPGGLFTPTAKPTFYQKRMRRSRKPNHFPPTTKKTGIDKGPPPVKRMESLSSSLTPSSVVERERTYRTLNWNAELSYPSPALSHSKRQFLSPINPVGRPDRQRSWGRLMKLGRGEDGERYDADEIAGGSSTVLSQSELTESNWHGMVEADNFIELRKLPEHGRSTSGREHEPLVQGPPGALYQDIARSQPDYHARCSYDAYDSRRKVASWYNGAKDHPTNVLRPLSLVNRASQTPVDHERKDRAPGRTPSGQVYRSPHAPPRRLSWQQLYTEEQLQSMQDAAAAESLFDSSFESNTQPPNSCFGENFGRYYESSVLNQQPLYAWNRKTSTQLDLRDKTRRFSTILLGVCTLFPPLLVMLALGRLDRVVAWWTKGQISAFEDKQKKLAMILVSIWGFAFFAGLIVILVFRFAPPAPSAS